MLALGVRDDSVIRVPSAFADEVVQIELADLTPGRLQGRAAYPIGVAWALGEYGADLSAVAGVDLYIESVVPVCAREMLNDETFRRDRPVITEKQRMLNTVGTLRESGPTAIVALVPTDLVSHLQVAIDGAAAEHDVSQSAASTVTAASGALHCG